MDEEQGDGEGPWVIKKNIIFFVVIYLHLSKLSVGQTPRLCNLPSNLLSDKSRGK